MMETSGARVAKSKRTISDACRTCTRQRAARAAATRRPEGTHREGEERPKEAGGGRGYARRAQAGARGSSKEAAPYPTSRSSRKPGRRARPGTPGWPPPAPRPRRPARGFRSPVTRVAQNGTSTNLLGVTKGGMRVQGHEGRIPAHETWGARCGSLGTGPRASRGPRIPQPKGGGAGRAVGVRARAADRGEWTRTKPVPVAHGDEAASPRPGRRKAGVSSNNER